jgi:chromosome segregation ATPase
MSQDAKEKIASHIRQLDQTLAEEREKVAELEEKLQRVERVKVAEDIALMMAGAGTIDYEDLLDHRDKIASSDADLGQMKTAMRQYGPGRVNLETVEEPEEMPDGHLNGRFQKEAETLFPTRNELPPDVQQAEEAIHAILNE